MLVVLVAGGAGCLLCWLLAGLVADFCWLLVVMVDGGLVAGGEDCLWFWLLVVLVTGGFG